MRVYAESIGIGESMYYGPGAGQKPTATSVVADLVRICPSTKRREQSVKPSMNTVALFNWLNQKT